MKGEIKKHPWAAVIGATIVGGLFLSKFIQGGASSIKGKL
jgi:hypothetical protein